MENNQEAFNDLNKRLKGIIHQKFHLRGPIIFVEQILPQLFGANLEEFYFAKLTFNVL